MNNELMTLNECQNDGACLYVYHESELNVWIAYGISAYYLNYLIKSNCWSNSFHGYSIERQMPFVLIDNNTIKRLEELPAVEQTMEKDVLFIRMADKMDMDGYSRWAAKLNNPSSVTKSISVETPVSKYVPKDRFIPDGMSGFSRSAKRLIDLFVSSIALIVFSPLFLICYIAVKMEDGGPAIFKQERIGRFGRPFYIYKFRSMRLDAEKLGPQLSASGGNGDQRLTKVGKFLRAHHLDELPQLWNVFCGDMAFVGPRPERKFFINKIMEYDQRYVYLYQIRPGVTSYATLYNGYTDTMPKMLSRLEYDLYYLGHRSFLVDFKILFKTFCAIVFGKKF
ncbi:MAG TPA: sugar transferase [Rikenellaceae bacterium]|nr:sugar transferase [Rikenellaceae bacterium]HCQ71862.1 sugar transferase [Rikenellaceae bacterium]